MSANERAELVRDLYQNAAGELVMVASDRTSVYDWVLPTEISDKGRILTQLSLWWFDQLADLVPNHVISTDVPDGAPANWAGRTMICASPRMIPVECVARGYLTGSGLAEYEQRRTVCGHALPEGLVGGSELPAPIFTPATKAEVGEHDENVSYEEVARRIGGETAALLRQTTLAVYGQAHDVARDRGIILADTKFEFGFDDERLVIGDEVLTPDCSRFWPADQWEPGNPQPSFDKQFIRDWLTSPAAGWDRGGEHPPPALPATGEKIASNAAVNFASRFRIRNLLRHEVAVRREAPSLTGRGEKDPPLVCRSRPVKLRAVRPWRWTGGR